MTPPRAAKLSGAELAAQLEGTAFPKASAPPGPVQPTPKKTAGSRVGRPPKGGSDSIPVNVRLAPADHDALAAVAFEMKMPGRPMLTVQDILRRLVRGALNDPATLNRLVREGEG